MSLGFQAPRDDEKAVRELTREVVDRELRPHAIEDDERCRFRREAFSTIAKAGLSALSVPKQYGGGGLSYRCLYGALEEVARASLSMTVTIGVTNLVQGAILKFGNDAQKEKYLRRLVTGEMLGAFALSEPWSGSDAAGLRTAAKKVSGGYRLTGTKSWISTSGHADLYLVMARTAEHKTKGISSFLVPKETAGFHVGKQEKKLGLHASTLAQLIFEDAFVPEEQRLGDEGQGLSIALSQLDAGRITIGTAGVGLAIEAIERCWRYRARLEADGVLPFEEGTQQALAEHYAQTAAVKALIVATADARDRGEEITTLASQVKLLGSDLAMRVTSDAVTWMGEKGYTREYEVERLMRDAKALQIVEGTNQIQRVVLARQMKERLR